MGLIKKSKKSKDAEKDAAAAAEEPANIPPAPSTTELGLRETHLQARTTFQRAQRAEQTYRIRKKATAARTDKEAAIQHFKNAYKEACKGMRAGLRCAKAMPAVVGEKKVEMEKKREGKGLEREEERRKKLEAEMKKVEEKKKRMEEGQAAE